VFDERGLLVVEQSQWHCGNATAEGAEHRAWIEGAFMDHGDVRMNKESGSNGVSTQPASRERPGTMTNSARRF
jgi:hypothetical protein